MLVSVMTRLLTGRRASTKETRSLHVPHRDEIRRHVDGRDRADPVGRRRGSRARSRRAMRCWSWSPPWPGRPTGWCNCAARPPRSTTIRNMTWWWRQRRAGHRRAAGDDAAESGPQGAQLHGLAIAPRHRGPRQCAGRGDRIRDARRGAEGRDGRGHPGLPGGQRGRPRGDARAAADRTRRRWRSPRG